MSYENTDGDDRIESDRRESPLTARQIAYQREVAFMRTFDPDD